MKSIIQSDTTKCFICGRNGYLDRLEEHHVYGGNPYRKYSEDDGMKVYLCGNRCHRLGKESVHMNKKVSDYLHKIGQKVWENTYGTREDFIKRYGKNYIGV